METCHSWVRYMFTCIVRRWHSCGTLPVPEVHASQQKSWGIAHGRDRPQSPEHREDALRVGLMLSLLRLMVTLASAPRAVPSLHKGGIRHIVTSAFCKGSQLTGVQWGSSANGMGWGLSREPPELDPDSQAALGHRPSLPPLLFLCDLLRASHPDGSPRNGPC